MVTYQTIGILAYIPLQDWQVTREGVFLVSRILTRFMMQIQEQVTIG